MPTAPHNTKCASLGCKQQRSRLSTYCLDHGGRDTYVGKITHERKEINAMYDQPFWKKFRKAQLSRQPLCQACLCQGHISPANQIDHLFAWRALNKEAFYNNIFQSLCVEHHSHKTGLEHKGIYRHYNVKDGIKDYNIGDYGYAMMHLNGADTLCGDSLEP